ncbi:MAG: hypothetical protein II794_08105 [Oscillospiraceae bacterium]|nr:hypothetical protein [Oscillospiraceae bacterium]
MAAKAPAHEVAPVKLELIITVCEKGKAGFYMDLLETMGANLQLSLGAKGTASREILQYLGLAEYQQSCILSLVRKDRLEDIMEALDKRFRTLRGGAGIALAIPLESIIGKISYSFLADERREM